MFAKAELHLIGRCLENDFRQPVINTLGLHLLMLSFYMYLLKSQYIHLLCMFGLHLKIRHD